MTKKNKITGLMFNAYCSYKACDNDKVFPVMTAGTRCPSCGKPLSWAGENPEFNPRLPEDETNKRWRETTNHKWKA